MQTPSLLRPKKLQKKALALTCLVLLFTPHCSTRKMADRNSSGTTSQIGRAALSDLDSYIRSVFRLSPFNATAPDQPGNELDSEETEYQGEQTAPISAAPPINALGLAHLAFEKGDYATALHEYQNIHATSVVDPLLEIRLAALLSGLGQWGLSCEHAEHAINLQPGWVDAQLIQSDCLIRTGRIDIAILNLENALASKPKDPRIRESLLAAYLYVPPESIISLPPWDSNYRHYEPVSWWYSQTSNLGADYATPPRQVSMDEWPEAPAGAQVTLRIPQLPPPETYDLAQQAPEEPAFAPSVVTAERDTPLQPIINEALTDPISFSVVGDFFVPTEPHAEEGRREAVRPDVWEETTPPEPRKDPFLPPATLPALKPAGQSAVSAVGGEDLSDSLPNLPEVDWIIRPTDFSDPGTALNLFEPALDAPGLDQWHDINIAFESGTAFLINSEKQPPRPSPTDLFRLPERLPEVTGSHGGFTLWEAPPAVQQVADERTPAAPTSSTRVEDSSTRVRPSPPQEQAVSVRTSLESSSPLEPLYERDTDKSGAISQNGLLGAVLVAAGVAAVGLIAGLGAFWVILAVFAAIVFTLGITIYTLNIENREKVQQDRI